jgi:hypothetical protein
MKLPVDFHFTASNLQDYLTCERRFELKAIEQRLWPALPSQPVQEQEKQMRNGILFHEYINQYFLGIPIEKITALIQDTNIQQWWNNFLSSFSDAEKAEFVAFEVPFAGYLNDYPVLAKMDAIRHHGKQWVIYDWKTGFHLPKAQTMLKKIQSRLYPYQLVKYGARLNQGNPITAEQINMVYWFPEFPTQEIRFSYTAAQYKEDEQYLSHLMLEITRKTMGDFSLTREEKNCLYCVYRSLCGRGTFAGEFSAHEDDEIPADSLESILQNLDLDQIAEIAF